jgi:methyl-accepting chemotaxis protein
MGLLAHDLNQMTESLILIIKEIIEANNGMLTTIEEARHAAETQSTSAIEHASSVNEITVSVEEIEKIFMQTLEKAKALASIAEKTREQGQQGLAAVDQSVKSMKNVREKVQSIAQTILELSNKTQQVGQITSVVNNLAQQSKMLALNASIEAAKAGEAGKGFAVVATEVKNLAEQSEQSTAQVQQILEDIRNTTEKAVMVTEEGTKEVDEGTRLTEKTGEIMSNLTNVIHEVTLASKQIEASVNQESTGIEQITAGMSEINQVTSVFVKGAEQTIQSIEHLTIITNSLKKQIDAFKI